MFPVVISLSFLFSYVIRMNACQSGNIVTTQRITRSGSVRTRGAGFYPKEEESHMKREMLFLFMDLRLPGV